MDAQTSKITMPPYIYVCALMMVVSGLMGAYAGLFNPQLFFSFFANVDWQSQQLPFLNGLWGTRNLAIALIMILALLLQNPTMLATLFAVRILTELQDIFILAPLRINPTGISIPETFGILEQFLGIFPWTVLLAEIIGMIGIVRFLIRQQARQ